MKQLLIFLTCLLSCLLLPASSQTQSNGQPQELVLGKTSQQSIFTQEGWHIWGADVIKKDDTYYMFYSRWPEETEMAGWLTNSEIALATASNAAGPFSFQQTVFTGSSNDAWDGGMVHSPQVLEYNNKYYLYYTAVPQVPENLVEEDARQYLKDTRRLGVAVADAPKGPWQRFDKPLIPTQSAGELDSLATANPAILQKDGRFLLIYKGIKQELEEQQISLIAATSTDPLGPFEIHAKPILDNSIHIEDPDIWFQNNSYYMIAHDVSGYYSKATDGRSLALFQSGDGLSWQPTLYPLASRRRIQWLDESISYFQRFERPHILLEDSQATQLYVAVREADGLAQNIAIPVNLK